MDSMFNDFDRNYLLQWQYQYRTGLANGMILTFLKTHIDFLML
ncbi:MAG: hypothetical protein CM15mP64_7980 [Candidatus Neomarinimicrobiota bacterium]|nr:MAG: hypothetical protein CM15mP64_7980 [Candidatus Neomarinimicrobiota bacterium]